VHTLLPPQRKSISEGLNLIGGIATSKFSGQASQQNISGLRKAATKSDSQEPTSPVPISYHNYLYLVSSRIPESSKRVNG
jgi:hypothetical protein